MNFAISQLFSHRLLPSTRFDLSQFAIVLVKTVLVYMQAGVVFPGSSESRTMTCEMIIYAGIALFSVVAFSSYIFALLSRLQ